MKKELLQNENLSLLIEQDKKNCTFFLTDKLNHRLMADMSYQYRIYLKNNKALDASPNSLSRAGDSVTLDGEFENGISFQHCFWFENGALQETISLKNMNNYPVELENVDFGMRKMLLDQNHGWYDNLDEYKLMSIPTRRYRSQRVDRKLECYTSSDIVYKQWSESGAGEKPGYMEEGWIYAGVTGGLLICKYNCDRIEYSRFARNSIPLSGRGRENVAIIFGGASLFDGNPEDVKQLGAASQYIFGVTSYYSFVGGFQQGFYLYRHHLEKKGHTIPPRYNPPVHWNELYNLGWFAEKEWDNFSEKQEIERYTLAQLYEEAALAELAGAESLYLDPGWDTSPGSCIWDEKRYGALKDFVQTLSTKYNLKLSLHLMMNFLSADENPDFFWKDSDGNTEFSNAPNLYRFCPNEVWIREKTARLLKLAKDGVAFFMFDFCDYGNLKMQGCSDPTHGHEIPMSKMTHCENIMRVIRTIKQKNPDILIETHDRVISGMTDYHPSYFQHSGTDRFDEIWGYEYMWNPFYDLISGKALSLYEYNMAYPIPAYLHVNLNSDNQNLLALWYYISVTRHIGIGGLTPNDIRFQRLQAAMKLYKQIKNHFTNGVFFGLSSDIHLHVDPWTKSAVIMTYNFSSTAEKRKISFNKDEYEVIGMTLQAFNGVGEAVSLEIHSQSNVVEFSVSLTPLSPCIIMLK